MIKNWTIINRGRLVTTNVPQLVFSASFFLALSTSMLAMMSSPTFAAEGTWRDLFSPSSDKTAADETPMQDNLPLNTPAGATLQGDEEKEPWMLTSPLGKVAWPEIKMPKFEFNPPWRSAENGQGGWLAGPVAKARAGAHNAIDRTRTAWNGTIERMKIALPGGSVGNANPTTQVAAGQSKPSFWERLLGPKDPAAEPEDVVELMARERANTQR